MKHHRLWQDGNLTAHKERLPGVPYEYVSTNA